MNGIKKVFLLVIAIESLVLFPLLAIKVWDASYEKVEQKIVIAKNANVESKVITIQNISKDKQKIVQSFLKEGLIKFNTLLNQQSNVAFLYSKEIYEKKREAVEQYSKNFLGKPYVWGATGPDSFDCSGFTQKVYGQWGIKIPRHSTQQAKVGEYISYENLERGDMVFFDTEKKARGVVNHVGIYLEDGKFIHASSGNKKVVITNFNEKLFYKNHFLWGRRVVKGTIFKLFPSLSKKEIGSLFTFLNLEKKRSTHKLNSDTLALVSLD